MDDKGIEEALQATGELLRAAGRSTSVVVVGGAGLAIQRLVPRTTNDVDIIALAEQTGTGKLAFTNAKPLPAFLEQAAKTVARDFGLPADWLNSEVGAQFSTGLPPDLEEDLTWRSYAALQVGYAGRGALIKLKLFAAADNSPGSVHTQDLLALRPTLAELEDAAAWVVGQDASPAFTDMVRKVVEYVAESAS
ncbi:MAG: hypothetical protein SFU84_09765 [Gemmatimonadales bacterium]|nr:hypothetical protein [Gemmatimonadales bacterium]